MLSITDFNYHQYKKVAEVLFGYMNEHLKKIVPGEVYAEVNPLAVLERWEKQSMDRAKKGLKIGLMDMFTSIADASEVQKAELDKRLREKNLPGLYELLNHAWDIRDKVIKKKKIRNLDEYYVIQEELSRVDAALTEDERKILGEAVLKFEKGRKV